MMQRANLISTTLILLSLGLLIVIAWRSGIPGQAFQESPLNFACEAFCSDTELRTSIAELSWQATPSELNQQALEVTVFSEGFQSGIQARLTPISKERGFVLNLPVEMQQRGAPSLDRLVLEDVQAMENGRVRVRIKNLEPGLNYFWRVRSADGASELTRTISCEAPVCPGDEASEPK